MKAKTIKNKLSPSADIAIVCCTYRVIFMEDHIPIRPDRNLYRSERQTSNALYGM